MGKKTENINCYPIRQITLLAMACLFFFSVPSHSGNRQILLQSKLEQAVTQGSTPVATEMILEGAEPDWQPEFIEKGSVEDLDTSCVEKILPAPFFTSLLGPDP